VKQTRDRLTAFRQAEKTMAGDRLVLYLYIAGSSLRSQRAVSRMAKLCESLSDSCELKVIDIFQQPLLAKADQIVAVPTLVKKLPKPVRLFVGDMSEPETILSYLRA
jgi:circadian clock protein KaiB